MAQPPDYDRTTDFAGDESNNRGGRSTVATADVNGELDAVSESINAINTNLALNQRDDGEIRDQRVKLHTLDPVVLKLITAFGGTVRGAWLTATAYVVKDVVTQGGNTYVCAVAHTSGVFLTDLAAVNWVLVQLGAATAALGVPFSPTATLAATNVQAAIDEADTENRALTAAEAAARAAADLLLVPKTQLASIISAILGSGMVGHGILPYGIDTVGGALFATVWGAGATDRAAQLTAANALGLPIRIIGACTVSSPVTITVPIVDTMAQIFQTTAQITIAGNPFIRPEWFGSAAGNIRLAVNAGPAAQTHVKCEGTAPYPPSYSGITAAKVLAGTAVADVDYLAKANVKITGRKLPNYKTLVAGVSPGLEGGTIIQGPFFVQAQNFEIDLIGVDSGPDVCTALYAGVAQEGLMLLQTNQVAPFFRGGAKVGRVIAICKGKAELVHACLFEALTDGSIIEATGVQAFHGVVNKSQNLKVGIFRGLSNGGEGVICKSDSYAPLGVAQIDIAEASSLDGTVDAGFGVLVDAVSAAASSIQIGSVRAFKKANGCALRSGGAALSDVGLAEVITDGCPIGYLLSGDVRRTSLGSLIANNATYGAQVEPAVTSPTNSIGTVKVTNATDGIRLGGKLSVGDLSTDNLSGYAVNYYDVAARLNLGSHRETGVANFWPLQPTLAGTWVNEGTAGNPVMRLTLDGGRVKLQGAIKSGAAASVIAALSVQIRPTENVRVTCSGFNGATLVPVDLQITTGGAVSIPNYAAAPTSIFLSADWAIPT